MSINKFTTPQVFVPPETSRLSYTYKSFDLLKTDHEVPKLAKFVIATFLLPISLLADTAMLMANAFRSKRQYTVLEQMKYASSAASLKIKSAAKSLTALTIENKSTILKVIAAVAVAGALVYAYRSYNAGVPIDSSTQNPIQQTGQSKQTEQTQQTKLAEQTQQTNQTEQAQQTKKAQLIKIDATSRNAQFQTQSDNGFWSVLLIIVVVATGLELLAKPCKKKPSAVEHTAPAPDLKLPQEFSEKDDQFLRSQCFEGLKCNKDSGRMIAVPGKGSKEYKYLKYKTVINGVTYTELLSELPKLSKEDVRNNELKYDQDLNVLYDYRVRKKYKLKPFDDVSSS